MNQVKLVIDGESWSSMGSHVEVSFVMLRMANPIVQCESNLRETLSLLSSAQSHGCQLSQQCVADSCAHRLEYLLRLTVYPAKGGMNAAID